PAVGNRIAGFAGRLPWTLEKFAAFFFESRGCRIAQPVQRLPQRLAPLLIPVRVAAGVAAAVAVPALDTVCATPRRTFPDLCFLARWMTLEIFTVIREFREVVALDVMQRIGERHLAFLVMMAISLAIRRDVHNLRPWARVRECGCE